MKSIDLLCFVIALLLASAAATFVEAAPANDEILSPHVADGDWGERLSSIAFVENGGRYSPDVRYTLRAGARTLFVLEDRVTFVLGGTDDQQWVLDWKLVGANDDVSIRAESERTTRVSYFAGTPSDWRSGLRTYDRIVYEEVWPGIDMILSYQNGNLKQDFVVRPGSDPSSIRMSYEGCTNAELTPNGDLRIDTGCGSLLDSAPHSFQGDEIIGTRFDVISNGEGVVTYGFDVDDYDRSRPLTIDPAMFLYCGFIGGSEVDVATAVAVDEDGCAYVTGHTFSTEMTFPVTIGPGLVARPGEDAFVAKVSADGRRLEYCGFICGEGRDIANDIAVDDQGRAYVGGVTGSDETTFPVIVGPDLTHNGGRDHFEKDGFVARVGRSGESLEYCGYIGGEKDDWIGGIDVDSAGHAYVSGGTLSKESSFPVHVGPFLSHTAVGDAFVAKLELDGSSLVYCGYIGGIANDSAGSVVVDPFDGSAYVAGGTASGEPGVGGFPVVVGPDLTHNSPGGSDAFVAKIRPDGSGLVFCGYIGGGNGDSSSGIDLDAAGNVYVVGYTLSREDSFPVRVGPDLTYNGGGYPENNRDGDVFVAKVRWDGTELEYCGYIGGDGEFEKPGRIAVENRFEGARAYVVGKTSSREDTFPVRRGPILTRGRGSKAFVACVAGDGSELEYCGYIGGGSEGSDEWASGVDVDDDGNVYVCGQARSTGPQGFPVTVGPNTTHSGVFDAFIAKLPAFRPCLIGSVDPASDPDGTIALTVNGESGDGISRRVCVPVGQPIEVGMMPSPAGPDPGPFALYAWLRTARRDTASVHPYGIGTSCFPTWLSGGVPKPNVTWNNLGHEPLLGVPDRSSVAAPSIVLSVPHGAGYLRSVTLQGILRDRGSVGEGPASVTNGIVLEIVAP